MVDMSVEGKVLCIGGPLDGERVENVGHTMIVALPPPRLSVKQMLAGEGVDIRRKCSQATYHLVCVRDSDGSRILLYEAVGDGMRPMARLVAGYRATQKPDG